MAAIGIHSSTNQGVVILPSQRCQYLLIRAEVQGLDFDLQMRHCLAINCQGLQG